MTFENFFKDKLVNMGMLDNQAQAVIDKTKEVNNAFDGRWDDDMEGYPEQMAVVIWVQMKEVAVEWIDENKPKAWYRPMFAGKEQP